MSTIKGETLKSKNNIKEAEIHKDLLDLFIDLPNGFFGVADQLKRKYDELITNKIDNGDKKKKDFDEVYKKIKSVRFNQITQRWIYPDDTTDTRIIDKSQAKRRSNLIDLYIPLYRNYIKWLQTPEITNEISNNYYWLHFLKFSMELLHIDIITKVNPKDILERQLNGVKLVLKDFIAITNKSLLEGMIQEIQNDIKKNTDQRITHVKEEVLEILQQRYSQLLGGGKQKRRRKSKAKKSRRKSTKQRKNKKRKTRRRSS